jgi:hypothetical protein
MAGQTRLVPSAFGKSAGELLIGGDAVIAAFSENEYYGI